MTTINDIADLARILREQPEWADALRSILLGQELLAMPARLAELAERFDQFVQLTQETHRQVNERLALLEANVERMNVRVFRLEGRFSNFEGGDYERRVLNRLVLISRQRFGLVNPHLAFSNHFLPSPDFNSAMTRAENDGLVTSEQVSDLYNTDVIISGPDNRHLLAEASITLGNDDVDRAKSRAAILTVATGGKAIPVVVAASADTAQVEYASSQGVAILTIPYP